MQRMEMFRRAAGEAAPTSKKIACGRILYESLPSCNAMKHYATDGNVSTSSRRSRDLGRNLGRDLDRDLGRDLRRDLGGDLRRDLGRDLGRDLRRDLRQDRK